MTALGIRRRLTADIGADLKDDAHLIVEDQTLQRLDESIRV